MRALPNEIPFSFFWADHCESFLNIEIPELLEYLESGLLSTFPV